MDAAIAASAVQCVRELPWCGLGGDGFALVSRRRRAGRGPQRRWRRASGSLATASIPRRHPAPLRPAFDLHTGPGRRLVAVVAALRDCCPFASLIEPAAVLADEGFALDHCVCARALSGARAGSGQCRRSVHRGASASTTGRPSANGSGCRLWPARWARSQPRDQLCFTRAVSPEPSLAR